MAAPRKFKTNIEDFVVGDRLFSPGGMNMEIKAINGDKYTVVYYRHNGVWSGVSEYLTTREVDKQYIIDGINYSCPKKVDVGKYVNKCVNKSHKRRQLT